MNPEQKTPRGSSLKNFGPNTSPNTSNLSNVLLKLYEYHQTMEPEIPADDQPLEPSNYTLPKYGFLNEEYCCQICLTLINESASLVTCQNGCGIRLHTFCVELWKEECKNQSEVIICPLCQSVDPSDNLYRFFNNLNLSNFGFRDDAEFDCFNIFGAILVSELENFDWTQKASMRLLVDKIKFELASSLSDKPKMLEKVSSFINRDSWKTEIADVARLCQIFATCVNGTTSLFTYNLQIAEKLNSSNKIFNRLLIPIIRTVKINCTPENSEFMKICQEICEECERQWRIERLRKKFLEKSLENVNVNSKFLLTRISSCRKFNDTRISSCRKFNCRPKHRQMIDS